MWLSLTVIAGATQATVNPIGRGKSANAAAFERRGLLDERDHRPAGENAAGAMAACCARRPKVQREPTRPGVGGRTISHNGGLPATRSSRINLKPRRS